MRSPKQPEFSSPTSGVSTSEANFGEASKIPAVSDKSSSVELEEATKNLSEEF
ncbi:MAG TPA: hypothetical protein V6D12_02350 [Candidatus Obscuribacterales bacterium]